MFSLLFYIWIFVELTFFFILSVLALRILCAQYFFIRKALIVQTNIPFSTSGVTTDQW